MNIFLAVVYQKEVVDKTGMVTAEKKKLVNSLIKLKFMLLENSVYLNITLYNLDIAMQVRHNFLL